MALLKKQQDEAVNDYEAMLNKWRTAKNLMEAARYKQVETALEACLEDARIWRLNTQAFINFVLGMDYKFQVNEIKQLAKEIKGTPLVRRTLGQVIKSYRR
jgi:alpha-glucuronidase